MVDGNWALGFRSRAGCERPVDMGDHLSRCDQAGALKMTGSVLMAGAPHEVIVLEALSGVIPATIAGVPVNHAKRCGELVDRVSEARDQHDRRAHSPSHPGQAAG